MPRYSVRLETPDGGSVIICGSKPMKACQDCRQRIAAHQCDYPVARETSVSTGTCDRWLCDQCRTHVDQDLDYCKEHAKLLMRVSHVLDPVVQLPQQPRLVPITDAQARETRIRRC